MTYRKDLATQFSEHIEPVKVATVTSLAPSIDLSFLRASKRMVHNEEKKGKEKGSTINGHFEGGGR